MARPTEATVLGVFDQASLTHAGETLKFVHEGQGYFVDVTPTDGEPRRYPIRYVFGVDPLQQLLLDVGGGRLQALTTGWDARPVELGGQRWFDVDVGDTSLHWAGPAYNWNTQCADCHSTSVTRGYDPVTDQFDTGFAAEDVSCEACHGPGSAHVEWAEAGAIGTERGLVRPLTKPDDRRWTLADGADIARLSTAPDSDELDSCGPCHARRADLGGESLEFHDRYRLALLDEPLYFADGQIRDEVFELGSFLQSKMYAAGVVCSDCHEPHGLELRAASVTETCLGCHRAETFDTPSHHAHAQGTEAARCESCHMPARTYMGVDRRHDHRFGVPRPELSARVGAPDPCLGCHADHDPSWAAGAIAAKFGAPSRATMSPRWEFASALWMARTHQVGASEALAQIVAESHGPAIVRATALVELAATPSSKLAGLIRSAALSDDVLLRRAAAEAAQSLPSGEREPVIRPLLADPVRSVRLEAVSAALGVDTSAWPEEDRLALSAAIDEYRASKQHNIDRAEALVDLANLDLLDGNPDAARSRLKLAIARDPTFTPAYLNLADLERAVGREAEAEAVLRGGLSHAGEPALVRFSLGLLLIRTERREAAVVELQLAHELAPELARLGYVYAIALFDTGQKQHAVTVLEAVHERHRGDPTVLSALIDFCGQLGETEKSAQFSAELAALRN